MPDKKKKIGPKKRKPEPIMASRTDLLKFQGKVEPSSLTKKRVVIDKEDIKEAGGLETAFAAKYGDTGKEKKKKIVYKVSREDFFDPKMKPLKGETKYFSSQYESGVPVATAAEAEGYEGADPNLYHYRRARRLKRLGYQYR